MAVGVYADDVTFTASAPDAVVNGDQFRLTYTINTQKVKDFRAPSISSFDVLMGPSRSQQSSTQIINGSMTSSSSITYTYILMATKEGEFTIPGATITANGTSLKSNSVKIKVLPKDRANGISSGSGSGSNASGKSSASVSGKDLFMTATLSKSKAYEQEAILLTYKVYTTLNLTGLQGKMPDLKGFHVQEVELPQKSYSLEHYNGRNYKTVVYAQYVLFPQQTGKLEIPAISFEGVVAQAVQTDDPFEAFFNGGSNYVEVKKKIQTPKLSVEVLPYPSGKPENFSGAVGEFSLKSSINATKVKTNDAVTLKLVISGVGNMKLIGNPEVKFPADFEEYDPKEENNYSLTANGLSGSKTIEYLAIPRQPGTYTIPAVEFSYFDPTTKSYKTLKSESYELTVEKGKGNADQVISDFTNKEDVKILGSDIRYIKTGESALRTRGDYFFGSAANYAWYVVPFALFMALLIVLRKQAMENANLVKSRRKKANKTASRRLKQASKLLAENKKNEFYDEVSKALWGYMSDKLNIPVAELTKDNIESKLAGIHTPEELTKAFLDTLNDCEFARYAPGDENEAMDKIYASAVDVISRMEDQIKHA
jgi:hypothetical protein